jgi:hypothetical protein
MLRRCCRELDILVGVWVHTPVIRKGAAMRVRARSALWLLGFGCVAAVVAAGPVDHRFGPHAGDVVMCAALVMLGGAVWALIVTRGGARRSDSEIAEQRRLAQAWWGAGRELTRQLVAGTPPPPLTVWGLVLQPGEVAYLHVPVFFSLFCALDPALVTSGRSVYYLGGGGAGSGGMVLAAAAQAIAEAADLSRAREARQKRWRCHEQTHAIVTDRRVLVWWRGRWAQYSYSTVLGFYPDLERGQVTLEFVGGLAPMRLQGPATASIAALLCWAIHGPDGLRVHPALSALR